MSNRNHPLTIREQVALQIYAAFWASGNTSQNPEIWAFQRADDFLKQAAQESFDEGLRKFEKSLK